MQAGHDEPEAPEPITIREAITTYRGGFYKELLRAHESGSVLELCLCFKRANERHRPALERIFPGLGYTIYDRSRRAVADIIISDWPMDLSGGLERAFPGLKALDELTDNPTGFDLLVEQPLVCPYCDGKGRAITLDRSEQARADAQMRAHHIPLPVLGTLRRRDEPCSACGGTGKHEASKED